MERARWVVVVEQRGNLTPADLAELSAAWTERYGARCLVIEGPAVVYRLAERVEGIPG